MKHVLRIILDTIFPPSTHERLLREWTPENFSEHLYPTLIAPHLALSHYEKPSVQAAIAACKFENNMYAAKLLTALLQMWLKQNPSPGITILIPLPLSIARKKERGFNQVERVIHYLSHDTHLKIEPSWLIRKQHTIRQTSLNRNERLKNMPGAFRASEHILLQDWNGISRVIICDDVLTTGATLTAARNTLSPHLPVSVVLVTLAWAH